MQGMTGTFGSRRIALAAVFLGIAAKYNHRYCWPSHKAILRLLEKYHQIKVCERTLCYDLKKLEREGFFDRLRRLTRKGINAGRFTSTLYKLKNKVFKLASGLGKWSNRVLSSFRMQKFAHNKSQRENEIFKEASGGVEILLKSPIEGKPSPVSLHG